MREVDPVDDRSAARRADHWRTGAADRRPHRCAAATPDGTFVGMSNHAHEQGGPMSSRRAGWARGSVIGVAVALGIVAVITAVAGSAPDVWSWPAAAAAGAFGGAVIGALLAVESEGESPDEAYDGD